MQRCYPGWEDLRHRRHREQRGSSPRQHGDLRPLHQHVDSPAVTALPALQTRLCCHQKVHSELLRVGQSQRVDGSLGPGQSVSDLWTWRQHPSTPLLVQPTPPPQKKKKPCAECTHVQLLDHVSWWCLTSSTGCVMVVVHHPTGTGTLLVKLLGYSMTLSIFSVLSFPDLCKLTTSPFL